MILPDSFIKRIQGQKYIDNENLQRALKEPSPVSIRINTFKWEKRPLVSEAVPWCKNGYYLPTRPSYTLDPLFHAGCYYPQEASGMFLEQVILQSAGSLDKVRVLDLCGAPGGKSTILSDLIGPDSLLVANEVIRSRVSILAETVTKWGSANTMVTRSDPAAFGKLPGFFDMILVDAPCSGEGMFRSEIAVSEWSPENADHCAERQKRILRDIWPALKENGILIYSTCTFNPGENEENIRWLADRSEAESIRLDLRSFSGITEIDNQGIYGYGFYPDKVKGEGFFISAVRKNSGHEQIFRGTRRQQEMKTEKSYLEVSSRWTNFRTDRILRQGDAILALPCNIDDYVYIYGNLKVEKAGTKIGLIRKNAVIPVHELALSLKLKREAFPVQELNLEDSISYLRRGTLLMSGIPEGWNIVTYNGVNLGFVKNLGSRVNNYYPVDWRIRMDASALQKSTPVNWQEDTDH